MLILGGTGLLDLLTGDVGTDGFGTTGGGGLGWGGDEGLGAGGGGGLGKAEEQLLGRAEGSCAGRGGFEAWGDMGLWGGGNDGLELSWGEEGCTHEIGCEVGSGREAVSVEGLSDISIKGNAEEVKEEERGLGGRGGVCEWKDAWIGEDMGGEEGLGRLGGAVEGPGESIVHTAGHTELWEESDECF